MAKRMPLDPRRCNIALDANALDRNGSDRNALVDRFSKLLTERTINVVLAGGVRHETAHPNTPPDVKRAMLGQIFNLQPGLNRQQQAERAKVRTILQGNAKPGAHAADASHISEAAETGCCYFITEEKRILKKREELASVIPPSLEILSLSEFFEIYDRLPEGSR